MTWWITQPGRAQSERIGLADLAEAATWLGNVRWRLESELRLAADFDIHHSGETFPLMLIYPPYFPDVPPLVLPADGRQISGHQYGAGGELCLEFLFRPPMSATLDGNCVSPSFASW
jgi:sulfur-carrier protein adenylyltransferase/sulfurtransferase